VGIVCVEQLQPHTALLDALQTLLNRSDAPQKLIFLEEGIWRGGFSMNFIAEIQERILPSCLPTIRTLAIRDHFCSPSKNESVYSCAGIDADHILAELQGE
jgi:deoxyxylulose-5-phosphate synthase